MEQQLSEKIYVRKKKNNLQKPNSENKEGEKNTPGAGVHTAGGFFEGRYGLLKDCTGEGS